MDLISLTVFWGLILAISKACSNAFSNGLHTIGVLRRAESWLVPLRNSVLVFWSSSESEGLPVSLSPGLSVSKHIIISKQSSNPSLARALATCTLSPFEKTYFTIRILRLWTSNFPRFLRNLNRRGNKLTIFRRGKLRRRLLRTGSGFRFS